jgi:hypothetical protein
MPFKLSVRAKRVIIVIVLVMVGGSLVIPAQTRGQDPLSPSAPVEALAPR